MKELVDHIKGWLMLALFLASYATLAWAAWVGGEANMHRTLTDDIKRYNDVPIPAKTESGIVYLYHEDVTYREFRATQEGK